MDKTEFPVLSIYLGFKAVSPPQLSFYLSQFHSLIHQNLSGDQQKFWQKDIERIEVFLRQSLDRSNVRSIVFFSSGKNLWQVSQFEFFLPPLAVILPYPYFKPIEKASRVYQKYLVLMVDREKARLFTVHLGKIEEKADFFNGQVPQRVRAKTINLGRTDKIMRDIEGHLHRHLQFVNMKTRGFIMGKNIHFIILGSHKELLPKIKAHLVYPLNKMVLGEFVTELNIPVNKILLLSKKIAAQINQRFLLDRQ